MLFSSLLESEKPQLILTIREVPARRRSEGETEHWDVRSRGC